MGRGEGLFFRTIKSKKREYPYPVSYLLRYRISVIKYSIVYFFSFLIFYLLIEVPLQPHGEDTFPVSNALFSGMFVSFYFIVLAVIIYNRVLNKVKTTLETDRIRDLETLLHNQKEESQNYYKELREHAAILERQSEEIRQKNLELKLAQHEIKEKANYLEIVSKYKSEFFANISHDLRTPLNSIIVLSQLIAENRSQNLTEKQKEFAQTIYSSGNVLLEFINEILDLTRIESGKIELRPEYISLWELADQMKMMFQPVAQQKCLEFSIEVEDNLPDRVLSDSRRLHQILRNLIFNAIKFTDSGSISIRIGRPGKDLLPLKSELEHGISISIIDTGIGVPENEHSEIFEAFHQVDGTTKSRYGGTGLGLTISRSLAVLLGGDVKLKSKVGEGSVFTLILPEEMNVRGYNPDMIYFSPWMKSSEKEIKEANKSKEADFIDDRLTLKKGDRVILIVDDDPSFATLLRDFATESGFKSLIAGDAESAVKLAREYNPGLVILDICLPGLSGWEVHELLKKDPFTAPIPVFYISGAEETNEISARGAIGFITKPVSIDKLREVFTMLRNITNVPVVRLESESEFPMRQAIPIEGEKGKIKHKISE